jgi:hypothetical protein
LIPRQAKTVETVRGLSQLTSITGLKATVLMRSLRVISAFELPKTLSEKQELTNLLHRGGTEIFVGQIKALCRMSHFHKG